MTNNDRINAENIVELQDDIDGIIKERDQRGDNFSKELPLTQYTETEHAEQSAKTEEDDGDNNRGTKQGSGTVGETPDKSGIPAKEQRPHEPVGDQNGGTGVSEGQGFVDEADTTKDQGDELPTDTGVVGQQADDSVERDVEQPTGGDGRLPGSSRADNDGGDNLSLVVLTQI